jgi:hypothetical protein
MAVLTLGALMPDGTLLLNLRCPVIWLVLFPHDSTRGVLGR